MGNNLWFKINYIKICFDFYIDVVKSCYILCICINKFCLCKEWVKRVKWRVNVFVKNILERFDIIFLFGFKFYLSNIKFFCIKGILLVKYELEWV